MKQLKKLTLLHSNDMHGDFLAEDTGGRLAGGVSMLSGYVSRIRREEKNVLYAIAGDMFQGSVIDSDFRGISTIQIMNALSPDIVTVGNHDIDYGIAHLLFLEKCADFPIINANLHITSNYARLFEPCRVIELDGMKILFIGVLTEMVLQQARKEGLVGSFVTAADAAGEVGRICNTYGGRDIDCTVLLTHIGFEEDKKLAALLDPAWGIDLIIGGHSHTVLTEPANVNGIPIVQAGVGTDQIGRFDLMIDTGRNCIDSFTWQSVSIDEAHCPRDPAIEEVIRAYKEQTDAKYGRILTRFVRPLTHPARNRETELGDLFSDLMKDALGLDIFLFASGSIRMKELGPVVTLGDLKECLPFDDSAHLVYMTGRELKAALLYMLRDEAFAGAHTEFYQLSRGLEAEYDQETHSFLRFNYEGKPVDEERVFTVGLQHFHYMDLRGAFDLALEELAAGRPSRMLATSCVQVIEESLSAGHRQDAKGSGRLILHLYSGGANP